MYWNSSTNSFANAEGATGYAEEWREPYDPYEAELISTHTEVVGADGIYSVPCGSDEWFGYARLEHTLVEWPGQYSAGWLTCGDTVEVDLRTGVYDAWDWFKDVIPDVNADVGAGLPSAVQFDVTALGCSTSGDTIKASSCFKVATSRISLTTYAATSKPWTIAHEYGHNIQHALLGGIWSASNCDPHDVHLPSSYSCALQEGYADYLGNVGGQGQQPFGSWENAHYTSAGHDAGEIEGNVAALFLDLIDSNDEGDDETDYTGAYIANVYGSCYTKYYSTVYPLRGVDQLVWCLENRYDGSLQSSEFGERGLGYSHILEYANEPGGWDADDIRSTWLQNVGN